MNDLQELKVKITGDNSSLKRALSDTQADLNKLGSSNIKNIGKDLSSGFNNLSNSVKSANLSTREICRNFSGSFKASFSQFRTGLTDIGRSFKGFSINTSSFKEGLSNLKNSFVGMGSSVKTLCSNFAATHPWMGRLCVGFKNIAVSCWGAFKAFSRWTAIAGGLAFGKLAKDSTHLYINLQKNIARLNQLGLAGKEQTNMFKKLGKVSKQYGVSMTDLTGATVQFYAAGVKDANKIKDKMKLIADASLFAGKSFEEMGFLLGKSLSSGYLDLTEFWQLNNAGIITLQDLIGKLGNNIEEVMDNVSRRKLTSDIAENIIRQKTAEFERLAQVNVGVAVQYFQNSFRKAQEAFSKSMFKSVFKGRNPAKDIYDFAKAMPNMFAKMGAIVGNLVRDLAPLGGILKEVLSIVGEIGKSVFNLTKTIFKSNALAPILDLLRMIGGLVSYIINMLVNSTFIDGIRDALVGINAIIKPIIDSVKIILWAVQPLIPLIGKILTALKPVLQLVGFLLTVILIPISAILGGIVRFIMNIAKWLGDVISRVSRIVSACTVWLGKTIAMTKPWKAIVKFAKGVANACKSAYNWVARMCNKLYNFVASPFRWVTKWFKGNAVGSPGFYSKIKGYATGGVVRVNERGGELISLPNGSTVIPHDYTHKLMNNNRVELSPEIMDNIVNKAINKLINTLGPKMDDTNIGIGRMNNGNILGV